MKNQSALSNSKATYFFLDYDFSRLNPDLGGSEVDLVHPQQAEGMFTTLEGPEAATLPLPDWLRGDDPFEVEEPVQFTGFLPSILKTDAPISDPTIPLYSKRMIQVLEEAGEFWHRTFQTQIEDDVTGSGVENYPLGRITEDFLLLQLPHLDILDLEKSIFASLDKATGMVLGLSEAVLTDVALPPIFRLKSSPSHILVSGAAQQALKEAGVRGILFSERPYQ